MTDQQVALAIPYLELVAAEGSEGWTCVQDTSMGDCRLSPSVTRPGPRPAFFHLCFDGQLLASICRLDRGCVEAKVCRDANTLIVEGDADEVIQLRRDLRGTLCGSCVLK